MNYSNKDYIEHLRRKYPPGTRLQLSCMEDDFPVPPGSMGTVECIDDAGQIHGAEIRHRILASGHVCDANRRAAGARQCRHGAEP